LSGGVIIAIMIIGTSMIMTVESTNANNYRLQSEINEYYLQAQLEHFKEYQRTQTETRRVRHDMKNHMIGMLDLYERNEYEKLGEYLKDLSQLTQNIDKEYHIGNDMADAILNEKFSHKKQENIELIIDGNMAGVQLAPIDVCTIFANAIDNAIEAVNKFTLDKVTIEIVVKRSNRILLITFTNPCSGNFNIKQKKLNTSKKDYINHGFGIENIRLAADKYNGSIEYTIIEDEKGQKLFCLEVMVMA
jgi:sensor histidine kinase regulating citrate/malate metabolism